MTEEFENYGEGLWKKHVGDYYIFISRYKKISCCDKKEYYRWLVMKNVDKSDFYQGELVAEGDEKTLEAAKKAVEKYV